MLLSTWKSSVPKISSVRRFSMQSDSLWSVDTVRKEFVSYFVAKHNHDNIISSPCVPVNDPTLLFTNAGMNQVQCELVDSSTPFYAEFNFSIVQADIYWYSGSQ